MKGEDCTVVLVNGRRPAENRGGSPKFTTSIPIGKFYSQRWPPLREGWGLEEVARGPPYTYPVSNVHQTRSGRALGGGGQKWDRRIGIVF